MQVPIVLLCLLAGPRAKETTLIVPPFSHDFGFHRASKFYIDMFLGRSFRFADPEGLATEKMQAEDDEKTTADDHILTLFGVNSGSGQILYNTGLKRIGVWPETDGETSTTNQLNHPHGIAVHRSGAVYVADTDNHRLVRLQYLPSGVVFVRSMNGFVEPYGVAVDSRGMVYVTDQTEGGQIRVLDSLGRERARWTGFRRPTGIAVIDRDARHNFHNEEFVVVIHENGQRISKLSPLGELLATVSARDIGLSRAEFAYCALDYYASIYVTDRKNDQLHKFDRDLNYLTSFGRSGTGDGEFTSPRGIAIGRQFGQVFIAEAEGGQYYWLGLDGHFIGCFPSVMKRDQPGTTIALYVTDMADLTISVYDQRNKVVRNLYSALNRDKAGELLVVWDGRDDAGTPVPPGEYSVHVVMKPTYGGAKRILRKEFTGRVRRV